MERLKAAIDANDVATVRALLSADPELHRAPMGYGKDGPLTWVAECRVPWEPPGPARLTMAEWMIRNGSDVHQGGDGPLMRAALNGDRIPMMELLVAHGADVNALWHGEYPILFAACEGLNAAGLRWLLEHGADPDTTGVATATALDYLIEGYSRDLPRFRACLEALLERGARTRYTVPAVMALLRGRLEELEALLVQDPALVHRRFSGLTFGQTGGRCLALRGATLLHVAAEFGDRDAAALLLTRWGSDVNARAETSSEDGVGGQTALFHAATQFDDGGLPLVELLLDHGADLSIEARVPGDYETPGEVLECTALGYAERFGGAETVELLRQRSGIVK